MYQNSWHVQVPKDFTFPESVRSRPRDFHLAIWLIKELGVVAIPSSEFTTSKTAPLLENWLRFAVCKDDEILEDAAQRLRGLKKFIQ